MSRDLRIKSIISEIGFCQQFFSDFRERVKFYNGNDQISSNAILDSGFIDFMAKNAIQRLKSQKILRLIKEEPIVIDGSEEEKSLTEISHNIGQFRGNEDRCFDIKEQWKEGNDVVTRNNPITVERYELCSDRTYTEIFLSVSSDLDSLCLSEREIENFLKKNSGKIPQKIVNSNCPAIMSFISKYDCGYFIIIIHNYDYGNFEISRYNLASMGDNIFNCTRNPHHVVIPWMGNNME